MARTDRTTWLLLALGGAVALLFTQRKTIMIYGSKALEAGKALAFKASLPSRAQAYSDMILQVARETGVDPFVIFAIGDRESLWGQALDANKTGDHTPRASPPWTWPMPPDGLGWGRGVMQVDYPRVVKENHNWRDDLSNIRLGVRLYQEKLAEVTAAPSGYWTVTGDSTFARDFGVAPGSYPALAVPASMASWAAMAAYNAGKDNVRKAYSIAVATGLDPQTLIDATTTGDDYSADTWARMLKAVANFSA